MENIVSKCFGGFFFKCLTVMIYGASLQYPVPCNLDQFKSSFRFGHPKPLKAAGTFSVSKIKISPFESSGPLRKATISFNGASIFAFYSVFANIKGQKCFSFSSIFTFNGKTVKIHKPYTNRIEIH